MNTIQKRLNHWREQVAGVSLRELRSRLNRELPAHARLSLGTLSNYESETDADGRPRAGPRAEFLVALQAAFPELRMDWLLFGRGEPTVLASRLAAPDGLEAAAEGEPDGSLAARVLTAYPDLALLSPEASALFMGTLTRYAMGEPRMAIDEARLLELAGDLRWFIYAPFRLWGFRHRPGYEDLSDSVIAMLLALGLAMPPASGGDAAADYGAAPNRALREAVEVGFRT